MKRPSGTRATQDTTSCRDRHEGPRLIKNDLDAMYETYRKEKAEGRLSSMSFRFEEMCMRDVRYGDRLRDAPPWHVPPEQQGRDKGAGNDDGSDR